MISTGLALMRSASCLTVREVGSSTWGRALAFGAELLCLAAPVLLLLVVPLVLVVLGLISLRLLSPSLQGMQFDRCLGELFFVLLGYLCSQCLLQSILAQPFLPTVRRSAQICASASCFSRGVYLYTPSFGLNHTNQILLRPRRTAADTRALRCMPGSQWTRIIKGHPRHSPRLCHLPYLFHLP